MIKRREFVGTALASGLAFAASKSLAARQSKLADAHIEVLLDEPIGRIAPEIYGHFVEHLGGVV